MDETRVHIETIRTHDIRKNVGVLTGLGKSLVAEGQRHPVTVWKDGTLLSGYRRLRCHFLLSGGQNRSGFKSINAVFVDNIEDAAKRMLIDAQDPECAQQMTWSDACRLWALLRKLDEPAAIKRAEVARRKGVELRKLTQEGVRKPGRSNSRTDDYVLGVVAEPFGISAATARRAEVIFQTATGIVEADEKKRQQAARLMDELDAGRATVWASYQQLMGLAGKKKATGPKVQAEPVESAEAAKQLAAWNRALPPLQGLVSGLSELGPPNRELTWEQVGPVHAQLSAVRRELEKMIKKMKEISER
jgi:hypothetical protein